MNTTLAKAMKTGAAARLASASARRIQMAQLRTAAHMHQLQNSDRRREISDGLVTLRTSCAQFRMQVRTRLRALAAQAAAAKVSR